MNRRDVLVYISGQYSGDIAENIHKARLLAILLWELGYSVFCPHLNTIHFENDCKCKYQDYIDGDLTILKRVDAILMMENWEQSRGAIIEQNEAAFQGIPIFLNIRELEIWFSSKTK